MLLLICENAYLKGLFMSIYVAKMPQGQYKIYQILKKYRRFFVPKGRHQNKKNFSIWALPKLPNPQGSLLIPKIEFFINADIRGWNFL